MNIVATIQARMTSSRLPGKVLQPVLSRPMLELLIERIRRCPEIARIVVATTVNAADQGIVDCAQRLGVGYFRGSEEDVLGRVLGAAQAYHADIIVEFTGDCPLLDPQEISKVIQKYQAGGFDYVSNVLTRTYPRGMDTQVFSVKVLEEVAGLTQDPADREHVSLYIYEHPQKYRLGNVSAPQEITNPDLRLCVDTQEDFTLIRTIFEQLYPQNPCFTIFDTMHFLKHNPKLMQINVQVKQKLARG